MIVEIKDSALCPVKFFFSIIYIVKLNTKCGALFQWHRNNFSSYEWSALSKLDQLHTIEVRARVIYYRLFKYT